MKERAHDLSGVGDAHIVPDDSAIARDPLRALRPHERLRLLADEGSLQIIRSEVTSERMGEAARAGDGVIGGALRIGGRPVFCFAQDAAYAAGSLGAQHADTIVRIQRLGRQARLPVIGFVESGGARMQEGLAALNGYARIFSEHVAMSGQVPQISVITGASAGWLLLTGAHGLRRHDRCRRDVPDRSRRRPRGHGRNRLGARARRPEVHARNGVCHFRVATDIDAIFLVRQLLSYLPPNAWEKAPKALAAEPSGPDPGSVVPLDSRRAYDVRTAIDGIVDADSVLECSPDWARNLVTAFARIDGLPVGIVANQPRHLGGVIDADASQKGGRFVRTCNAFGLPLVVLVDTPGFLPGSEQEAIGAIRHGAKLLHAFAEATVPRFTVVLRKSFGGAYITMNSKGLGADLYLAWSRAELGIMGAHQAVGVVHRRALSAASDPVEERRRLAATYAIEHLSAQAAARIGAVDEVIRPAETRSRLSWALSTITGTRQPAMVRNIPL